MSHAGQRHSEPSTATALHAMTLVHPVTAPHCTADLLSRLLGFRVQADETRDGLLVDNGALSIRLVPVAGGPGRLLELEVEVDDHDEAYRSVEREVCIVDSDAPHREGDDRIVQRVELEGGMVLRLTRVLTEDDLGILPPLPASLVWDRDTDLLVRRVLRAVPLSFREGARNRVTRYIESLALEAGRTEVGLETAVRGLVEATPDFQHHTLRRTLLAEGVNLNACLRNKEW